MIQEMNASLLAAESFGRRSGTLEIGREQNAGFYSAIVDASRFVE